MSKESRLRAQRELVREMQAEVTRRQTTWNKTGDRMDLYLYKSARTVLRNAESRLARMERRREKKA